MKNEKRVTIKALVMVISSVCIMVLFCACASLSDAEKKEYDENAKLYKGFVYVRRGSGYSEKIIIQGYLGESKEIIIPSKIRGLPVEEISYNYGGTSWEGAFENKQLTKVTIPYGVRTISGAFANNQLTQVTIPESVMDLGGFSDNQLTEIVLPKFLPDIGYSAFARNKLTNITITDKVLRIGSYAFAENQLINVTIGSSVYQIKERAFSDNQLTSVTIPNNVQMIYPYAFANNPLSSVTIGSGVYRMGENAFPNGLEAIYLAYGGQAGTYTWEAGKWYLNGTYLQPAAKLEMPKEIHVTKSNGYGAFRIINAARQEDVYCFKPGMCEIEVYYSSTITSTTRTSTLGITTEYSTSSTTSSEGTVTLRENLVSGGRYRIYTSGMGDKISFGIKNLDE